MTQAEIIKLIKNRRRRLRRESRLSFDICVPHTPELYMAAGLTELLAEIKEQNND